MKNWLFALLRPLHNTSCLQFSQKILGRSHEIPLEFRTEIQGMTAFVALCRGLMPEIALEFDLSNSGDDGITLCSVFVIT